MKKIQWVSFLAAAMLACTFAYSRVVRAGVKVPESSAVCHDESVASLSGFNNEATCPSGSSATGGGYEWFRLIFLSCWAPASTRACQCSPARLQPDGKL